LRWEAQIHYRNYRAIGLGYNAAVTHRLELKARQNEMNTCAGALAAQVELQDDRKVGRNLYPLIFILGLVLWLYSLFFYSNMSPFIENTETNHFVDSIREGSISGVMALFLCFHSVLLVGDRAYYAAVSQSTNQSSSLELLRLGIIFSLLLTLHLAFMAWGNAASEKSGATLWIYYYLCNLYLLLSLQQFQVGLPKLAISTLRPAPSDNPSWDILTYVVFRVYTCIPFLHELKVVIDWTFRTTSLELRHYLLVEDAHNNLWMTQRYMHSARKMWPGQKQPIWPDKFLFGILALLGMLACILLPLFLFSSFGTLTQIAPITDAVMHISANATLLDSRITTSERLMSFDLARSSSPLETGAQVVWLEAEGSFSGRDKRIARIALALAATEPKCVTASSVVSFTRAGRSSQSQQNWCCCIPMNPDMCSEICSSEDLENVQNLISRRNSAIVQLLPKDISVDSNNHARTVNSTDLELEFTVAPRISGREQFPVTFHLKRLSMENTTAPSFLRSLGLISIYVSLVFAIGRLIKAAFQGTSQRVIYEELPNPEPLIDVILGLELAQRNIDLKREFQLYQALVLILRSPETLLEIGGSRLTGYGQGNSQAPPFPELLDQGIRHRNVVDSVL